MEYVCDREQGNMRKHLEAMHIVDRPLPCSLCGRLFKNKNTLSNHVSLSHRSGKGDSTAAGNY